jgi:XTP/dITP diphosphohydrolase
MSKLILATHNAHKVNEIFAILKDFSISTTDIVDAKPYEEPIENGTSFEENAFIKAKSVYEQSGGIPSIGEDSGIVVDVLGKAPGIFSARWSGVHSRGASNTDLLLAQLADIKEPARGAKFVTAAVLYINPKNVILKFGSVEGMLTKKIIGNNGFGYDPIFVPNGYQKTMAQLTAVEKNHISHRRRAFEQLAPQIKKLINAN